MAKRQHETAKGKGNIAGTVEEIERRAEQRAPGVLDLVTIYDRAVPSLPGRLPINATAIRFTAGTSQDSRP